jgi:ribosomal protein S18 acetylase RimI-like enzyme
MIMNVYSVERIKHHQRHIFPGLFKEYRIYRSESSSEESSHDPFVKGSSDGGSVFFVVLKNQPEPIPVGFIQLYSMQSSTNDAKATHVKELFVVPDYRNNGIALKLIEAAVKFAIENKSAFIQLKTVRDNLIAQRLFESVGFTSQPPFTESKVYSIQFS